MEKCFPWLHLTHSKAKVLTRPTSPLSPHRHAHPPVFSSPVRPQFLSLPPHNWLQPTHTWFTAPFLHTPHQPRLCFTFPASSPLSLPQLQLFLPWSLPPHHSIRPHSQGFWGVLTK